MPKQKGTYAEKDKSYDIAYMWNLKRWYKWIYKSETDAQTLKTNLWMHPFCMYTQALCLGATVLKLNGRYWDPAWSLDERIFRWHLSLSHSSQPQKVACEWVKVAQLCLTLCNLMDYTIHGILQARILEWVAFPFSRGSSQSMDQIQVSHIAGRFFTSWATREAQEVEWLQQWGSEKLKKKRENSCHLSSTGSLGFCLRHFIHFILTIMKKKEKDVK